MLGVRFLDVDFMRINSACGGTSREANLILSCRRTSIWAPGRGDFLVSNFHPGVIPGNWSETISGNEEREVGWPVFGLPPSKSYHGERIRCDCDAAGTLNSCPQTEPSALGPATHRSARARDGSQRWLPAPRRAGRGGSPCEPPE